MEETVIKYINESGDLSEMIDSYIRIRKELKELGHTEETIGKVSFVTAELYSAKNSFHDAMNNLKKRVQDLFDVDNETFFAIIEKKINNLNELFPLNNGGKKRNNRRNKDTQRD